jgi:hypothetical protein
LLAENRVYTIFCTPSVQQAVVTILNAIYEVDFKGFSYGFRPGRGPHQALDALNVGICRKHVSWILDADIRGFLDPASYCPRVTEKIRLLLYDFDSQAFAPSLSK